MPSQKDVESLSEKCKQLNSLKANILRSTAMDTVEWLKKEGGGWEGGVKAAKTQFVVPGPDDVFQGTV